VKLGNVASSPRPSRHDGKFIDSSFTVETKSLGRGRLYKPLWPDDNPEVATLLKVLPALGLRLEATDTNA